MRGRHRKRGTRIGTTLVVASLTLSACMAFYTRAAAHPDPVRVDISETREQRIGRPDRARHIERGPGMIDVDEQAKYLEQLQARADDAGYRTEVKTNHRTGHKVALAIWTANRPGDPMFVVVEPYGSRVVFRWPLVVGVEPMANVDDLDRALDTVRLRLGTP
ncbi:MAG TPA: hypothetical protein VI076_01460 [Actinopolymorphaceae bacterium]